MTPDDGTDDHGAGQSRRQVLLIDDHAILGRALALALDLDARLRLVGPARTIHEGMQKLELAEAVILDLYLPDAGGIEAVTLIRPALQDRPLIVYSSAAPDELTAAMDAGADACVVKGRVKELIDTVLTELDKRGR